MIFDVKKLVRSFGNAARGIKFVAEEQNFRIQAVITVIVALFVLFFRLKALETSILIMAIALVLTLEIINSIFERIVDVLEPRSHPHAKVIKDMMASAVLVASCGAVLIGIVIFGSYAKDMLGIF